ncbi:hypothetical protein UlMin_042424 [Ulmus minor]
MKLAIWNIQGIGNPWTSNSLLSLVKNYNHDVLFLMETKLEKHNALLLRKKLGFLDDFTVSRVGLSGGLMLLRKEKCVVNVCSSSNFFIDAWISSPDILPWRFSGFYGNPDASQRVFSWEMLRRLWFAHFGAWLCAGDFNEILNYEEKVGGGVKPQRAIDEVNKFHFEEAWSNDSGCGELIKSCWEVLATLGLANNLLDKLDWCGRKLHMWGSDKFKRLGKDISGLKKVLDKLSSSHSRQDWEEVNLVSLFHKEEQYWKQRSTVSWLRDGEKNTKFFHRKASNRRFKNEILGICNENGCWQTKVGLVK